MYNYRKSSISTREQLLIRSASEWGGQARSPCAYKMNPTETSPDEGGVGVGVGLDAQPP